jgi:glycine cleavage system H protein
MTYKVLPDLRYLAEHDWAKKEGDIIIMGITDFAQKALKDVVYIDLPEVGETFNFKDVIGSIESVKAVSDLLCPIGGEVLAVNEEVVDEPGKVNEDPYSSWLLKIKPTDLETDWNKLMNADEYTSHCNK